MNTILRILFFTYCSANITFAQNNFYKSFDIYNITNVIKTFDNGFACVTIDGGIFKMDSLTQLEFNKRVLCDSAILFNNIIQTTDSGFIISSLYNKLISDGFSLIAKFDKNGNYLWSKSYYNPNASPSVTSDILSSDNNGFYLLSNVKCNETPALIKCNEFGEIIWKKSFNYTSDGYKIVKYSNSKLLIFGTKYFGDSSGNNLNKLEVYLVDTSGNALWLREYDYNSYYTLSDIIKTTNNEYSILMTIRIPDNVNNVIMNIDSLGNLLWTKKTHLINLTNLNIFNSFAETSDKGYLFTGVYYPTPINSRIMYMKTDSLYNIEWTKCFGNISYNNFGTNEGVKVFNNNHSYFVFSRNPEICDNGLSIAKLDLNGYGFCNFDTINFVIENILINDTTIPVYSFDISALSESESLLFNNYAVNSVVHCTDVYSINSNEINNSLRCFPNPTSGLITIEAKDLILVEVIEINGKTVHKVELRNQNSCLINVSEFTKGIYIIKIITINDIEIRKIILE